ncbi:glycoside hydrolase family 43 protein [Cytophagaceae bacterium YF14B1]|uniref:Glycoside hydrolase family 43 protein n=1 Tax=Xanthocytophaga flava TaxID=3048013 RepID=A0AAE3QU20_9BACT|nr:glycoside hydrolase family 43 protein [Xanthocytophaga flavus]MDJ1482633.1 glycoside hydrolase family 43 protein [Xanthocytophaga flavus]
MKHFLLAITTVFYFSFLTNLKAQEQTFSNPLLPSGADPYSTYYKGYYYYSNSIGGDRLQLRKTKNLANLKQGETKIIWQPPQNTKHSKELWAPEVHHINGKWYVYYAADDGDNNNHRMYVIENSSEDPFQGEWKFKGKLATPSDKWAIDGDVFTYKNQLYMIWSGWEGDKNGQQDIYIARMKNPYTMEGERIKLSSPTLEWERRWQGGPEVYVNEGPQFLQHGDKVFIVYSASGCWTDHYSLGLLELQGHDLLNPDQWKKHPQPIFTTSEANGVYSPAHNSFFTSPDGKEDWILYHANDNPGDGCGGKRSPRMQKFTWNADGTPNLGIPVSIKEELPAPSESK